MGNKFTLLWYLAVVLLLPVLTYAGDLSFRLPKQTPMEPGYARQEFPRDAVAYLSAREILRIAVGGNTKKLPDYGQLPGAPRIIGMGHSFTVPGYQNLERITKVHKLPHRALVEYGGADRGSVKYLWELENGIYQHQGGAKPKLLAALANSSWDVVVWGPYIGDRVEYYYPWVEFTQQYQANAKFYLSTLWPNIGDINRRMGHESEVTVDAIWALSDKETATYSELVRKLNARYGDVANVLPTSAAIAKLVEAYLNKQAPDLKGLHKLVSGANACVWRDGIGHLCKTVEPLIGYVYFAGIYGRNPELLPSGSVSATIHLDRLFRKIAWQAVIEEPLSGVRDKNGNGINDAMESIPAGARATVSEPMRD